MAASVAAGELSNGAERVSDSSDPTTAAAAPDPTVVCLMLVAYLNGIARCPSQRRISNGLPRLSEENTGTWGVHPKTTMIVVS